MSPQTFRRRRLLAALGALALGARQALGQPAGRLRRVGILGVGVSSSEQVQMAQLYFASLLRRAGLEEGRDIVLDWRFAEGDASRLPALARDLVRAQPDLIVASFNQSIEAARAATKTIPIVMLNCIAPLEQGYVQSLARPGGNVTGTAWTSPETMGKVLEVMKHAAPQVRRVAILGNPAFPGEAGYREASLAAAARLGLALQHFHAARLEDVGPALRQVADAKVQALFVGFDTVLIAAVGEMAKFALARRLVSMSTAPQFVDAGGLLYYGPDFDELAERTVSFVTRILAGARPADLPVELPTRYQLVVNRKTAAAIGHRFTQAFLLRADRVIE